MSIDNNSKCVRSKYFVAKPDMDESLTDFQEAKQSCKGPKPVTKATKPKTRKVTKRIKGQKDIRTALKGKKNELEAYTKEFDNVCKKSGLDVDSEQLQLAIALSKSLQTESNDKESSSTLSSQQRVAKIRKTLQEYGFKVPEAKITAVKKTRKLRKQYKLLTTSDEEKQQIITGKYSQVLFENLDKSYSEQNTQNLEARVFHLASNTLYECMKDDCIFYVDDLVEKSTTNGALLRDWSEIPGRPQSPKLEEPITMDFKDIDCSQDELDVILSGSIKSVKDVLDKYKELKKDVPSIVIDDEDKVINKMDSSIISIDDNEVQAINKSPFEKAFGMQSPIKKVCPKTPVKRLFVNESCVNDVIEIISPIKEKVESKNAGDVDTENKLKVSEQYRSVSPDIFDDELSSIIDVSKPTNILSQEHKTKVFSQDNFMDLTQCANVNILSQNSEKGVLLSQDVTKRRSNDFMEITECIVGSSQPIREEFKEIDLTQSPEANKTIREGNHSINLDKVSVNISNDTQQETSGSVSQNVTDEQNVTVVPNNRNNLDIEEDNVDLTQSSNEDDKSMEVIDDNKDKNDGETVNLTQSSNSDDLDELPSVNFGDSHAQTCLDDTIIVEPVEYISNNIVKESMLFENRAESPVFDLTQGQETKNDSSPILPKDNEPSTSFYEDFVHDHSEPDISKEVEQNIEQGANNSVSKEQTDDIDLTQSSGTSEEISNPIERQESIPNNSSLGKNGDISIDYDEIINEDNSYNTESFKDIDKDGSMTQKSDPSRFKDVNPIEVVDDKDEELNSSQNSEVFHISDKELDYSLHKSRYDLPRDNFDFGGISVLDNITRLDGTRNLSEVGQRVSIVNENAIDSLPDINFGNENEVGTDKSEVHVNMDISSEEFQDVLANTNGVINVKTPNKSEYVIKTCDVTPMSDYTSMSTPERNKELDKYGLKPFKRKRAIKILTHLYNQMHPTVQQLVDEDQPSCKKPRLTLTQDSSPKKLAKSPSKSTHIRPKSSPLKIQNGLAHSSHTNSSELERERCILSPPTSKDEKSSEVCAYEVSSELAIVKATDCSPDDWVFQKREKAKVHSCRVPLHIAFHNYVLSRRSLREAILRYEPVNIDVIHKDLVGYGHRYDPKELLKFLDKRCITVKTTDNNARNNRR